MVYEGLLVTQTAARKAWYDVVDGMPGPLIFTDVIEFVCPEEESAF